MKYLSLKIPGPSGTQIEISPPAGVPAGARFSLGNILTIFLGFLMVVGIILSTAFLVYGGILWITSSGDKQKLDKARKTLLYSIIGLIVMSLSLLIINVLGKILGLNLIIG